jgi:FtsP/CotA-like multicopper oxidase with cupredoxin domain
MSAGGMRAGGMGGMDHQPRPGRNADELPFGDAGDVTYPYYVVNGRLPMAPDVMRARPGQRIRLRIVNAASDTIFAVALAGHQMLVTHSDGFPVVPTDAGALYVGMGERYDVVVTLEDGAFSLVAEPVGKPGVARALVRTGGTSAVPPAAELPSGLSGPILQATDLAPAASALLPARETDDEQAVRLTGQMMPYRWAINGAPYGENEPLVVTAGDRIRLGLMNMTMMTHPMHVHGHTFALPSGLRKDTVLVPPMSQLQVDVQADNPGSWMTHCHNVYHAETGMMIEMKYRA